MKVPSVRRSDNIIGVRVFILYIVLKEIKSYNSKDKSNQRKEFKGYYKL